MNHQTSVKFARRLSLSHVPLPVCLAAASLAARAKEEEREGKKPAAHHAAIRAEDGAAHAIAGVQRLGDVLGGAPQRARAVVAGAHVPQPRVRTCR